MPVENPILVTGAAGSVGAVGRTVVELLRGRGLPVRALVRREDERAEALRATGSEVVVGDLTHGRYDSKDGCLAALSQYLQTHEVYKHFVACESSDGVYAEPSAQPSPASSAR